MLLVKTENKQTNKESSEGMPGTVKAYEAKESRLNTGAGCRQVGAVREGYSEELASEQRPGPLGNRPSP
jgi:hypothetical protein